MSYNIVDIDTIRHIILFVNIYYIFYKTNLFSGAKKPAPITGRFFSDSFFTFSDISI